MWTCPECARKFGRVKQSHECAPAMTLDEYLSTGPPHERAIVEAVLDHVHGLGGVHVEPVSVGIFFKRGRTFAQVRPMQRWVALHLALPRRVVDGRIARKVVEAGRLHHHVVNLRTAADYDAVVQGWVAEAHADAERGALAAGDAPATGRAPAARATRRR